METNRSIESPAEALRQAVAKTGSQSAFARLIGVTQGAVSKWFAANRPLPHLHVLTVERATGVSRHDLRPDLYPREAPEPGDTPDERTPAPTGSDRLDHAAAPFGGMEPLR